MIDTPENGTRFVHRYTSCQNPVRFSTCVEQEASGRVQRPPSVRGIAGTPRFAPGSTERLRFSGADPVTTSLTTYISRRRRGAWLNTATFVRA